MVLSSEVLFFSLVSLQVSQSVELVVDLGKILTDRHAPFIFEDSITRLFKL